MVADFVERGGFIMVGGYLSFAGFNGMANYHDTVIESVLPITVSPYDYRVEVVAGFRFEIVDPAHPAVAGLDWDGAAFTLCGYNQVTLKPDAHLVARYRDDPMIATGTYGQGRTAIFVPTSPPTGPTTFRAGMALRGSERRCCAGWAATRTLSRFQRLSGVGFNHGARPDRRLFSLSERRNSVWESCLTQCRVQCLGDSFLRGQSLPGLPRCRKCIAKEVLHRDIKIGIVRRSHVIADRFAEGEGGTA
jgi:hypothetical protein